MDEWRVVCTRRAINVKNSHGLGFFESFLFGAIQNNNGKELN